MTECPSDKPELCSQCQVRFNATTGDHYGECVCAPPVRCALCTVNSHYRINNECEECPDNPALLIIGFFLLAIGACVGGYILNKKNFNLAFISIGIDYFQVLALFAQSKILWPPGMIKLFNFLSIFNFNIDISAPECLVPNLEYELKWWLTEMLPIAAALVLLFTHIWFTTYKFAKRGKKTKLTSHVNRLIAVYLVMFYYLYLNVTKKALDIFNCNPPEYPDGFKYTSFSSLECEGGLCRCGEGIQARLVPWAAIFLVMYSFGFPAIVFYIIKKNKELIKEDQYLRAFEIGDTRETNHRCYDIRKRYHKVYYHFKPGKIYWIVYIIFRKFGIAFSSLMFRGNPSFQLSVVLLLLFWSYMMQVTHRPYMSTGERPWVVRDLKQRAQKADENPKEFGKYKEVLNNVNKELTNAAKLRRAKQNRRFRSERSLGESKRDRKASVSAKQRAKEYFFDYNTVETVLLGCAIFVCLSGIMFESGRFDDRPDIQYQRDLITWLVFLVIFGSIVYYMIVFASEVFSWESCAKYLQSRRKGLSADVEKLNNEAEDLQGLQLNPMHSFRGGALKDDDELRTELEQVREQNKRLRDEVKMSKMTKQLTNSRSSSARLAIPRRVKKMEFSAQPLPNDIDKAL